MFSAWVDMCAGAFCLNFYFFLTATLTLYSVSCVSCFMCVLLSVLISNIGSIANRTVRVQKFQTCSKYHHHYHHNSHWSMGGSQTVQWSSSRWAPFSAAEWWAVWLQEIRKNTKSNNVHLFIHPYIKQVKHQELGSHLNKQNAQSNKKIRLLSKIVAGTTLNFKGMMC